MSRKSVSRNLSRSPVPPMEKSNLDEQRLGLNNIMEIDPWKDIDKYDKQEVGQIQEILVHFNNMVVEDKKNKRRSVGKNRTSSTKIPAANEALEAASTTKENPEHHEVQREKSESITTTSIKENTMTNKTGLRNTTENPVEGPEKHLEENTIKSSESNNHVRLDIQVNDKKNKEKSVEKRRTSTSTTKNKIIKNDTRKSCFAELSIDMPKNPSIENTSGNQHLTIKSTEHEDHPEQKKNESSQEADPVELDMLNDRKNKRKSVEKRRTSTSSAKVPRSNADPEGKIKKTEKMKNDAIRQWIRDSNVNDAIINVPENLATGNSSTDKNTVDEEVKTMHEEIQDLFSEVRNRTDQNIKVKLAEHEDHPEEKGKKSSTLTYPVELDILNGRNNKRKSVEKRRTSTSSTKVTRSNADPEEKMKKTEKMRNDIIRHWISESSVNDAIINVPEDLRTENSSNNQNTVDEERKTMREEIQDLSSKVINRREQSSVGKQLISSSAMKTIVSNKATKERSTLNKEKIQYSLITSDGAGSIVDPEENIDLGHNRDSIISIGSYEKKNTTQKLEEIRGQTISQAMTEKIVDIHDTFTVQLPKISVSDSLASRNDQLNYVDEIEFQRYKPSCDNNLVIHESIISGHLRYQNSEVFTSTNELGKLNSESANRMNSFLQSDDHLEKQSSTMKPGSEPERERIAEHNENKFELRNTLDPESQKTNALREEEFSAKKLSTMKARAAHSEPHYKKFAEYNNNNGLESMNARKHEEKMAKAFEKFGKKFVKYSSRMEQQHKQKMGPNDGTIDSKSDSHSSYSSSSSSSDEDFTSSESTSSSGSTCSCCSGSSSNQTYTSCSDFTSCSCPSCCDDDMYSEYTLASSGSTHSRSDDSTDSSMD